MDNIKNNNLRIGNIKAYHEISEFVVVDNKDIYVGLVSAIDLLKLAQDWILELDTAINSSFDGFCFTDGRGIMLETNEAYHKITGFLPEEVLGKDVRDLEKQGYISQSVSLWALQEKNQLSLCKLTTLAKPV
ncbi:MAG: hypothetical protein PWQ96_2432 [Clostridia bacterium]|nr:hypothetical protein [Clostridia bacterium]